MPVLSGLEEPHVLEVGKEGLGANSGPAVIELRGKGSGIAFDNGTTQLYLFVEETDASTWDLARFNNWGYGVALAGHTKFDTDGA